MTTTTTTDNDEYTWPNVYEEANDMLDASLLMYPIATLRRAAKTFPDVFAKIDKENDNKKVVEKILQEPITAREVKELLQQLADANLDWKNDLEIEPEEFEVLQSVLQTLVQRNKQMEEKQNVTMYEFRDDNSQEELVYAIGVDDARKRVTVSFRGSVTGRDWLQNAQIWMETFDNPMLPLCDHSVPGVIEVPEKIRVHNGFYDYLYYQSTETQQTKYQNMMDQTSSILKQHPGYKLYITGHSLGGALACFFSFLVAASAACSDNAFEFPTPITCVSIASPFVGNYQYRAAYQYLEAMGKLRHLRVVNQGDFITALPYFALNWGTYKHVGLELNLERIQIQEEAGEETNSDDGNEAASIVTATLIYPHLRPKYNNAWTRVWRRAIWRNLNLNRNHSPPEYSDRLDEVQPQLEKMDLNTVYEKELAMELEQY